MHGLKGPWIVGEATGIGTHEVLADTLLGGRLHAQLVDRPYVMKKHAWETCVQSEEDGILESINVDKIMSLPSMKDIFVLRIFFFFKTNSGVLSNFWSEIEWIFRKMVLVGG